MPLGEYFSKKFVFGYSYVHFMYVFW